MFVAALRAAEAGGAEVRHLRSANGRPSGARVQWFHDEPGMIRGGIKSFTVESTDVRFFVENDFDEVQRHLRCGEFYEPEELAIIRRAYTGGVFVDVGANVGNHAIYAAKLMNAPRVIAFEPEPLAAAIFEINAALNECGSSVVLHRVGLGELRDRTRPTYERDDLGSTRLHSDDCGAIEVVRGDDLLATEEVGFVKIDTEGFELAVLAGLETTIERCRPPLFVEVENENIDGFRLYCESHQYRIAEEFRRYDVCTNFLVMPS